jgi:adenine-specific DNA-methyltransferase
VYSKSGEFEYLDTNIQREEIRKGFWRHMDDSAGQGSPKNFFGKILSPPPGKHFKYSQDKIDEKIGINKLRLVCKNCGN